jgi:3-methylcrotonyl-CoA carboxylase beta subunit
MAILTSRVNARSEDYQRNAAHMQAQVDALTELASTILRGGGERARQRHRERGKLLPRERIDALLDPGAPFLEIGQLAAHEVYGDEQPAAGVVAGVGRVSGRSA